MAINPTYITQGFTYPVSPEVIESKLTMSQDNHEASFGHALDPRGDQRQPVTHELKCHTRHYQATINGLKPFELRLNDRDFQVGDWLKLKEYDPEYIDTTGKEVGAHTGSECEVRVTSVLRVKEIMGPKAIPLMDTNGTHDYVVLGLDCTSQCPNERPAQPTQPMSAEQRREVLWSSAQAVASKMCDSRGHPESEWVQVIFEHAAEAVAGVTRERDAARLLYENTRKELKEILAREESRSRAYEAERDALKAERDEAVKTREELWKAIFLDQQPADDCGAAEAAKRAISTLREQCEVESEWLRGEIRAACRYAGEKCNSSRCPCRPLRARLAALNPEAKP